MARRVDDPTHTTALSAYGAEVEGILRRHVKGTNDYAGVVTRALVEADLLSRATRVDAALSMDWTQDRTAPASR